jgi:hypothetical protein
MLAHYNTARYLQIWLLDKSRFLTVDEQIFASSIATESRKNPTGRAVGDEAGMTGRRDDRTLKLWDLESKPAQK